MSKIAKLLTNGRGQTERLPTTFQCERKEVYIQKDSVTDDVVLAKKPANWNGFLALIQGATIPADFLRPMECKQAAHRPDPFAGWEE